MNLNKMARRYPFAFSKSRIGRWHGLRVIAILAVIAALTWYGKYGADNPIGGRKIVRVSGGVNAAYVVSCVAGRDGHTVAALEVSAGTFDRNSAFMEVYPFSDSVRAAFLTFANAGILVCDSAVYAPGGAHTHYREKLELLIVPSSSEENILRIRNIFRPRYMAVIPPCEVSSIPNVICSAAGNDGAFTYDFEIRRGKARIYSSDN